MSTSATPASNCPGFSPAPTTPNWWPRSRLRTPAWIRSSCRTTCLPDRRSSPSPRAATDPAFGCQPSDVELIRAVAASNPRTVVVLQGGSAILCSEWDTTVPAVVHAWYGGGDAGSGLADVLFGRAEPAGRLPISVPADESDLPQFAGESDHAVYDRWHGWWHLERAGHPPAYPFGFGLAYTTFSILQADAHREGSTVVVEGRGGQHR